MPTKEQYQMAEIILANVQKAFYFWANNKKESIEKSNRQTLFIQQKIKNLLGENQFKKELKKIPSDQCDRIKVIRNIYVSEQDIEWWIRLLSFFMIIQR